MLTKEHKIYLERLRRSGVINMFGAAPYVESHFDVSIQDARKIVAEWMQTYDPNDEDYADLD